MSIFQASFPVKYESMKDKNEWIIQGIENVANTEEAHAFTKNGRDPKAKAHSIEYCKTLRKVIKEAKKQHYS